VKNVSLATIQALLLGDVDTTLKSISSKAGLSIGGLHSTLQRHGYTNLNHLRKELHIPMVRRTGRPPTINASIYEEVTVDLLQQFHALDYKGKAVRTLSRDNKPWFVAKDVCDILGITNSRNAFTRLSEKMKGLCNVDTPGGPQQMQIINEPGVYKLSFTSRKPYAEAFTDWLASDVLPSLRHKGSYSIQPPTTMTQLEIVAHNSQTLVEHDRRLNALEFKVTAIMASVSNVAASLVSIEKKGQDAEESLLTLPAPSVLAPELSVRMQINRLVRGFVNSKGVDSSTAYNRLYAEFRDRHGVNLWARINGKEKALDVAERLGMLEQLYAVAHSMYGASNQLVRSAGLYDF
jgi:prophage antirepressor-like protein